MNEHCFFDNYAARIGLSRIASRRALILALSLCALACDRTDDWLWGPEEAAKAAARKATDAGAASDSANAAETSPVADTSVADTSALIDIGQPGDADASDTVEEGAGSKAQTWNVLIYMSSDNDLEASGIFDLEEILEVDSAPHLRFYIQVDRAEKFYKLGLKDIKDWTGTKRLVVKDGKVEEVSDLGEINMGKAESLRDFIIWGTGQYKADKNVFVMWNHGMGWRGFGGDDYDKDLLTIAEIKTGIEQGLAGAKIDKFDLAGFDACLMGDIVAMSMMRPFALYLIAS